MDNIIKVFENGRTACRYEYDALGRLTREDNVAFSKTTTWAYDNNGNIIAKFDFPLVQGED
jgi:YD repeat-containing protein